MTYTRRQMMAVALAREIEDGKTYIIGTGLPLIGGKSCQKHTCTFCPPYFRDGNSRGQSTRSSYQCPLIFVSTIRRLFCGRSTVILVMRPLHPPAKKLMRDFWRGTNRILWQSKFHLHR